MDGALPRLEDLTSRITYPGLILQLCPEDARMYLRWGCPEGTCNVTGEPRPWAGRKWRLSPHMTDGEVVWTAFKALMTVLEHEARERFLFDGVPVADSHIDIHKLVALHKEDPQAIKERDHHA